jgi:hypothetical protein
MEVHLKALLELIFYTKPPNFGVEALMEAPTGVSLSFLFLPTGTPSSISITSLSVPSVPVVGAGTSDGVGCLGVDDGVAALERRPPPSVLLGPAPLPLSPGVDIASNHQMPKKINRSNNQ